MMEFVYGITDVLIIKEMHYRKQQQQYLLYVYAEAKGLVCIFH